ncbi:uncharacterized protein KGF55_003918 [Candida pseudojiufengensis]|uniref:uncharacterized protein n=1 Tax=Candida pseudojiufengensis TaxID=497109 RepID=UPI0022246DDA|nr:uncharacterized protein KGF55_003918 [Candida pseudojiufengensis]KAI5961601.1 hypothetical protein KGF55_003918 [Candida pseudojiufengensis]
MPVINDSNSTSDDDEMLSNYKSAISNKKQCVFVGYSLSDFYVDESISKNYMLLVALTHGRVIRCSIKQYNESNSSKNDKDINLNVTKILKNFIIGLTNTLKTTDPSLDKIIIKQNINLENSKFLRKIELNGFELVFSPSNKLLADPTSHFIQLIYTLSLKSTSLNKDNDNDDKDFQSCIQKLCESIEKDQLEFLIDNIESWLRFTNTC